MPQSSHSTQSAQSSSHRASERKFLAWTAGLVLILGVPAFYSFISKNESPLVSAPRLGSTSSISDEDSTSSRSASPTSRVPASTPETQATPGGAPMALERAKVTKTLTAPSLSQNRLMVPCLDSSSASASTSASASGSASKDKKLSAASESTTPEQKAAKIIRFDTTRGNVLLQGGNCYQNETDLQIQNSTNGFTAEVIFQPQQGFTTDFLPLSNGVNRIVLKPRLGDPMVIEVQRLGAQ